MKWLIVLLLSFVLLGTFAQNGQNAQNNDVVSARLRSFLGDQKSSEDSFSIWVEFTDKDCDDSVEEIADIMRDERLRSNYLRALARRARVAPPNQHLAENALMNDFSVMVPEVDRSVCKGYVDGILAIAPEAVLRQKSRWINGISISIPVSKSSEYVKKISNADFVRGCDLVRSLASVSDNVGSDTLRNLDKIKDTKNVCQAGKSVPLTGTDFNYGISKVQNDILNVPAVHKLNFTGSNITMVMLDSGFDIQHESLVDHVVLDKFDYVRNVSDVHADVENQWKHGTATMSCIGANKNGRMVGTAPDVEFLLYHTEDTTFEKPIEEDYFVSAIERGERLGGDMVSTSLGYTDFTPVAERDGKTGKVTIAVNNMIELGMTVVVSAANSGPSPRTIATPADAYHVISVGALERGSTSKITGFSSRGPTADDRIKPEVVAMGSQCCVATAGAETGYYSMSGTSFSCPLTAGMIASVLSKFGEEGVSPFAVRAAILSSSSHSLSPDNNFGYGLPDAKAMLDYLSLDDDDSYIYAPKWAVDMNITPDVPMNITFPFIAIDHKVMKKHPGPLMLKLSIVGDGEIFVDDKEQKYRTPSNGESVDQISPKNVTISGFSSDISRNLAWLQINSLGKIEKLSIQLLADSTNDLAPIDAINLEFKYIATNDSSTSNKQEEEEEEESWVVWLLRGIFILGAISIIFFFIVAAILVQRIPVLERIARKNDRSEEFVRLQDEENIWVAEMQEGDMAQGDEGEEMVASSAVPGANEMVTDTANLPEQQTDYNPVELVDEMDDSDVLGGDVDDGDDDGSVGVSDVV